MGLGIPSKGYNIFIQGAPGTGRRTTILQALSEYTVSPDSLQDKVYVSNFTNPVEPNVLSFPKGKAQLFKQHIHDFVEDMKKIVPLHGDSDDFRKRKGEFVSAIEKDENRILAEFEAETAAMGFQIVQISDGEEQSTDLVPLRDGSPTGFEELQAQVASGLLSAEEWSGLRTRYYELMDRMKKQFGSIKRSRSSLDTQIHDLTRHMLEPVVAAQLKPIRDAFPQDTVERWIDGMQEDILSHLFYFAKERVEKEQTGRRRIRSPLVRYGVNILIDRADCGTTPVIFENRPSISNLIGTIETQGTGQDDIRSAYLRIRAGSILKASGGVLVIRAEDILEDEEAWLCLKRVLQTGIVEIQNPMVAMQLPSLVKPEPIETSLKVIMIGGESIYDTLYLTDPDFQKLFKICAEFDTAMERNDESEMNSIAFLQYIVEKEGLGPITPEGASAVLEWSVRNAEHRNRLSTRFSQIADLLREADWLSSKQGNRILDGTAIRRAMEARSYLHRLPEEKLNAMVLSDEIIIQTKGSAVGKANGLAIHDRGYYSYGLPVAVSARVAPGDGGVINIEGESGLSGEIFDKAVLILTGYLRSRYATMFPLSITASVCFEQMYTPIDGDSATSVQLCALLSAISGIPIRQDLAITGSVNQLGDMQPVGGIPEKIEGFYSICSKQGLSGSQGVVIPKRNLNNLILSESVEEAIRQGAFHIFAVENIDQAMETLTGKDSGQLDSASSFPINSVNGIVSKELKRMADVIRRYET
jgi:predicted ATP-dependent protease